MTKQDEIMEVVSRNVLSHLYNNSRTKKYLSHLYVANALNDDTYLKSLKADIAITVVRNVRDILVASVDVVRGVNSVGKVPAELDDIEYRVNITGTVVVEFYNAIPGGGYSNKSNKVQININVPYDIEENDMIGLNGVLLHYAELNL